MDYLEQNGDTLILSFLDGLVCLVGQFRPNQVISATIRARIWQNI
jgi:hypothetical protein